MRAPRLCLVALRPGLRTTLVTALLCAPWALRLGAQSSLPEIPSLPLASFQDSLGVNLHMEYTDGKYADVNAVLADLEYIGIHNVRDGTPQPAAWQPPGQGVAALRKLGANGIHFNLVAPGDSNLSEDIRQINLLQQSSPGMVISIEGPNEINNAPVHSPGLTNEQAAERFQRLLYSAVKSNALTASLPVYYFTGGAPIDLETDHGLADFANTHPYPHGGEQPFPWLEGDFRRYFTMQGNYPKAITETGYYTLPQSTDWGGVDDQAQAQMILNAYFDAALQGVSRTYVYQLLDPYPDPKNNNNDDHFGFFHLDNSPKVVAAAMHNLCIAFPPDKPSAQKTVRAAITGLPAGTGHVLALTESNGSIAVFTWNEAPVWNEQSRSPVAVRPAPIEIRMDGAWNVSFYSPSSSTLMPLQMSQGSYQGYTSSWPTAFLFTKK